MIRSCLATQHSIKVGMGMLSKQNAFPLSVFLFTKKNSDENFIERSFGMAFIQLSSDGRVERASAFKVVFWGLISIRVNPMVLKLIFTAFLL